MISIRIDPTLAYPEATDNFSPDERFPEYPYEQVSQGTNRVYRAIRDVFVQAGLDSEHQGTALWNPLGEFIERGNRVFLLCNFVEHRRPSERLEDFQSRCSHGSVIRALTDYILIAAGETGSVSIGNAPTQECDWEAVLRDTEALKVLEFYESVGAPVTAKDLRLFVLDATRLGSVKGVERRDEADGVNVLLDRDSLFDELDSGQDNCYRVMDYDPRRIGRFHSNGHHEYVISRHILEADVIFSTPKLKTHEKTGITCAIKGMVGTVAHKDSLPHHRYGPPERGGDEYPTDPTGLARMATRLHEAVQCTRPDTAWGSMCRVFYKVFRRSIRHWAPVVGGAWCGNDTTWRMAADVARIGTYADSTGALHETPRRKHLVLTDGIIGGEGEGPLRSTAIHSGILALADELWAADYVNAVLMGFDPGKIPTISASVDVARFPLMKGDISGREAILNGQPVSLATLMHMERPSFEPQKGWKDVLS